MMRNFLQLILTGALLLLLAGTGNSQTVLRNPEVSTGYLIKVIPSLKDLQVPPDYKPTITRIRDRVIGLNEDNEETGRVQYSTKVKPDPVVQQFANSNNSNIVNPNPLPNTFNGGVITQNFDGMGYTSVSPADPSLCAGPNHIVQMINGSSGSYFKIWDRSGVQVVAQTYLDLIVAGTGYTGSGDPVPLYDQFSNRFMFTEFGHVGAGSAINTLIVVVSQTADPTGGWYVYRFTDATFFPDYPHWGIWPNAIFASTNDFNTAGTAYLGSSVYAMNKTKMIAGDPTAEVQRFRLQFNSFPVNISGSTPPTAGSPGLFMYYSDDDFTVDPNDVDSLGILAFNPNFAVPASTTLTFAQAMVTAPFKSGVCGGRNCVPSAAGNGYDALSDRIMNRVWLRKFPTYDAMVLNYTVDANAGVGSPRSGLRWYELRRTTGNWSIFQQSTYAPPDADWRWMGSININSKGQIALGYNLSGPTKYASVFFTGRNSGDALNTMSIQEVSARNGTAYGTFGNRWGDYNDMATDIVDVSRFWMTAMYGNAASQWATRVTQFKIGDCDALNTNLPLPQGPTTRPEGQTATYTNTVNNTGCVPIVNFLLTDTLPTNVTFVSATNGGTYNAGNRVVSWPVNVAVGASQNYQFTVSINAGAYFPPITLLTEPVAGAGIPAGWAATSATGPNNWVSSNAASHSAPNSLFAVDNPNAITDFRVSTTAPLALGQPTSKLTFWHNYNTESGWDGGVVEISTNGGGTWTDLGPQMTINRYNNTVGGTNPISGRPAFSGSSNGWIQTTVNLLPYANLNALFRFRMTSDDNTAAVGWYVDDIVVSSQAQVNIRTSLFNASGVRIQYGDTFTIITPPVVGCVPPSVTSQPANVTACIGTNASFTIAATGDAPLTYQWQESTNGGGTWNNVVNGGIYSGATTVTLTLTGVIVGMNNYQYRCIVTNTCPPSATSNVAVLTVSSTSVGGNVNPAVIPVCGTTNTGTFTLTGHTGNVIRWESSTVGAGGPWTTIANTTTQYTFLNITQTTWYRAVVQVPGCSIANSSVASASFTAANPMSIQSDAGTVLCQGDPARLTAVDGGGVQTFTNAGAITIPSSGIANPSPANLVVSGLPVAGVNVSNVQINGFSHTWAGDVNIVLQHPNGTTNVILLANSIADPLININNVNLTFDDAAAGSVPANAIATGTYKPTNRNGSPFAFLPPGPTVTGPTFPASPTLASFTGDMNGTWKLFVEDRVGGDQGQIAGGYSITFNSPTTPITTGTFLWTPAAGLNSTTINPVAASPAVTTTYTVNHNNGAGCIRQAFITLTVNTRPGVSTQPVNTTVCAGSSATFTAVATGTGATYQWQESTNGGVTWVSLTNGAPYSGVTTGTLTINPTTVAMNGYRYRLAVSGTCPPVANSNGAILTVNALPVVTVNPAGPVCGGVAGTNGTALTASGATSYTWAPLAGLYTNATATTVYTGTNLATVYAAPTVNTVYTVTGTAAGTGCSNTATSRVVFTPPAPTVAPASVTMCLGDPAVKLKAASATTSTVSFSSGTISVPIPDNNPAGATSNITVSGIPAACNVTGMAATWNLTHTWNGDMVIALRAPNNQILNLDYYLSGTGGAGATTGFVNTKVSSAGVNALSTGTGTYTGTFRADAVINGAGGSGGPTGYTPTTTTWAPLYGTPNGIYTLAMYDGGAADLGTLTSWNMDITYVCGVVTSAATWSPNAGLFLDAAATVPYDGREIDSVWTRPTPSGLYNYQVTVRSAGFPVYQTFSNPAPITIPNVGTGTPYPSNLVVSGLPTTGASVDSVKINGMSHTWSSDIAILLQSPNAPVQNTVLMAGVGGANVLTNVTYTFVDGAPAMGGGVNPTGLYAPTSVGTHNFPAPGPGAFSTANPLSAFTGNMNGTWKLFVVDEVGGDQGQIAGGYSITFKYPGAGCTSPPRIVPVTVNDKAVVTTQPVDRTICTDKSTTFTVVATGSAPLSYRWQVSTDGGNTFSNLSDNLIYSGTATATLTITAPPVSYSGYYYRCVVQSALPCTPTNSFFAKLTVNPLPTVVISAAPFTRLFPGRRTTLTSSVSPFAAATYTWRRDGVIIGGTTTAPTGASREVDIDGLGTYNLTVTDVNGCTNTSNDILISDSAVYNCFLYPNPSAGRFQVRYYSVANNSILPRSVTVYDGRGARVLTQYFGITAPYARMDLDLRPYGHGVYWVEIGDRNGSRIAVCRAVVE